MDSRKRVVVVDGIAETEEVLKAVFEPRGMEVARLRSRNDRWDNDPDSVFVLHEAAASRGAAASATASPAPRVVVGRAEFREPQAAHPHERRLTQPFHYGELVRAIEDLLEASS